jgi:hypothetical protein
MTSEVFYPRVLPHYQPTEEEIESKRNYLCPEPEKAAINPRPIYTPPATKRSAFKKGCAPLSD